MGARSPAYFALIQSRSSTTAHTIGQVRSTIPAFGLGVGLDRSTVGQNGQARTAGPCRQGSSFALLRREGDAMRRSADKETSWYDRRQFQARVRSESTFESCLCALPDERRSIEGPGTASIPSPMVPSPSAFHSACMHHVPQWHFKASGHSTSI